MGICKDIKPVYGCKSLSMRNNFLPDPNATPAGATHHQQSLCPDNTQVVPDRLAPAGATILNKNKLIIDESVYLPGTVRQQFLNQAGFGLMDPFRSLASLFYMTREIRLPEGTLDKISQYAPTIPASEKAKLGFSDFIDLTIGNPFSANPQDALDTASGIYGQRSVTVSMQPEIATTTPNQWESLVKQLEAGVKSKTYYDHVFTTKVPFDEKDLKNYTALDTSRYRARFNFEYNYYIKEYEELLLSQNSPSHRLLPSLYIFESERYNRRAENIDSRNLAKRWIDLSNQEKLDFAVAHYGVTRSFAAQAALIFDPKTEAAYNKKYPQSLRQLSKTYPFFGNHINLASGAFVRALGAAVPNLFPDDVIYVPDDEKIRYFNDWVRVYKSIIQNYRVFARAYLSPLDKKFTNTAFTTDNFEELVLGNNGFNGKRELFPMFVQMRFPTDIKEGTDSTLKLNAVDLFERTNMDIPIVGYVMETLGRDARYGQFESALSLAKEQQDLSKEGYSRHPNLDAGSFLPPPNQSTPPGTTSFASPIDPLNLPLTNIVNFYENKISTTYQTILNFPSEVSKGARRVWNLIGIIELFNKFEVTAKEILENQNATQIFDGRDLDIGAILGTYPIDIRQFNSKQYKLFKKIWLLLASTGLKDLMRVGRVDASGKKTGGLLRSLLEVMQGRAAESETAFYRIEKRRYGNAETVQNFYVPNSSNIDIAEWVDTQVKYDEEYIYQVYAYQIVYGTAYNYESFNINKANKTASATVKYRPSLVLVEEPFFFARGKILDSPPVAPDVDVVSFVDDNRRVMINLFPATGDYLKQPLVIDDGEEDYINSLPPSVARFVTTFEDGKVVNTFKVRYKNDDPVDRYKIYRIEEEPSSYEDFAGEGFEVRSTVEATSATFIDKVIPNKKYYYVFRSIDFRGHLSYPSPVYEIEMVDDSGSIYLEVKILDLKKDPNLTYAKPMKRFIKISPAAGQSVVDLENTSGYDAAKDKSAQNLTNVKLGTKDRSVYGKKFKIRITSKSSGKKIDINVRFNKEHEKMPEIVYDPPKGKTATGKPLGPVN